MMYGCKIMVSLTLCRFLDHPVCDWIIIKSYTCIQYFRIYCNCDCSYHEDNSVEVPHTGAESSYVHFEDHGHQVLPARQNWSRDPSSQDIMVPQPQVPAYRPAPDYDTVMQQRTLSQYYSPSYVVRPYLNLDCTSFSQPDIYQHSVGPLLLLWFRNKHSVICNSEWRSASVTAAKHGWAELIWAYFK